MDAPRPNILVLMTDEHNPRYMGCSGHPIVQTPHLDALAARGVRFANAYCQGPLCVPSRMSNLTGKQVHKIRAWSNGSALDSSEPTIPGFFAECGYVTANAGKMHFVGPDQYHGFQLRPFGDGLPEATRLRRQEATAAGRQDEAATAAAAATGGAPVAQAMAVHDALGPNRVRGARPEDENRSNVFDRRVTEESVRFLREWQQGRHGDRPFLLWSSWLRPHFPFTPPRRYWDLYDPAAVDLPHAPPDILANCPPRLANWRRHWGLEDLSEEETRRARAAYYAMTTFVDAQIGAVLDELRALGLEEDTFVVYLADHGDMVGEHGLWYKSVFFDGAAKVPFIFRYPRALPAGRVVDAPVELVDLFPTLAAAAGRTDALPPGLDGADLGPLAAGAAPPPKDAAYSEHYTQGVPSLQRMIRTARWKYNYYEGERGELYDMQADPDELRNLAGDPAYRDVVRDLEARALATWDLAPVRAELDAMMARQRVSKSGFSYTGPNRSPGGPAAG